jgi:hypothetical protein
MKFLAYFLPWKKLCMYGLIMSKMGWATFWAIFSRTHLVTLVPTGGQVLPLKRADRKRHQNPFSEIRTNVDESSQPFYNIARHYVSSIKIRQYAVRPFCIR